MRYETKTLHIVDYRYLEEKIREVYGKKYDIPRDEECGNDCSLQMGGKKEPLLKYDSNRIETFRNTGRCRYLLRTLVQDMINNDHIPEGDWLVEVSW